MLKDYLSRIQDTINKGDAREESYYSHLDSLIKEFAIENGIKKIDVTILPKKTEAGNPDFRVWDGKNHITGYIEAKDPSVDNLDRIEESEQLTRYRSTFPNLILTNFYEFRLYRDGELVRKVTIGRQRIAQKLKTAPPVENEKEFNDLLGTFFSFSLPQVRSAKALAQELAKRTRFLRDEVVSIELAEEGRIGKRDIMGFYEAFRKYLIGTLTERSFAISKYQGESENDRIERIAYDEQKGRIYINKNKYFDGITPEVWGYEIGGYQVLQKYLKDRKGRNMDDSKHYSRVITAISATIELQRQIDETYPLVENELLEFLSA